MPALRYLFASESLRGACRRNSVFALLSLLSCDAVGADCEEFERASARFAPDRLEIPSFDLFSILLEIEVVSVSRV
jgi:hypothetical protein